MIKHQMHKKSNFSFGLIPTMTMVFGLLIIFGCQGTPSRKPPIHLNPNMDSQNRYDPQSTSDFFENGMSMRMPVEGAVAVGELRLDDEYFLGKDLSGNHIDGFPNRVDVTEDFIYRGQQRYNIYCAPCHSQVGDGKGIVMEYNYPIPPPSFHTENVQNMKNGYFFDVISNGVRNMPSYKHQVGVEDRWAIVTYIRALQKSQNAKFTDIPEDKRQGLK
jgi:hypothetical protein